MFWRLAIPVGNFEKTKVPTGHAFVFHQWTTCHVVHEFVEWYYCGHRNSKGLTPY